MWLLGPKYSRGRSCFGVAYIASVEKLLDLESILSNLYKFRILFEIKLQKTLN